MLVFVGLVSLSETTDEAEEADDNYNNIDERALHIGRVGSDTFVLTTKTASNKQLPLKLVFHLKTATT